MAVARTLVYNAGRGFDESVPLESISDLVPAGCSALWLDIQDPTDGDIALLRQEFGFHELALEDVVRRHQRAKVDQYDGYYFVVFYIIRPHQLEELHLFFGDNYLVTIHHGDVPEIAETAERWRRTADRLGQGIPALVYSLIDAIVDGYFPVVDGLAERVERVESAIFDAKPANCLPDLFTLKMELLQLRRTLTAERDVLNVLLRRELPVFGEGTAVYFQDIYDHIIRVVESVDLYREQLTGLLDAYVSVSANHLNVVMKRMTAISAILMSLALIAGIYGMNYTLAPSQDSPYGFWFAVGSMATLGVVLFAVFKRIDWL